MPLPCDPYQRSAVGFNSRLLFAFPLLGFCALAVSVVTASAQALAGVDFFEKKIRPILVERCYECHSADKKIKGGLTLDTAEGWRKGGDTGPAIIPGDLEQSLLIKAVRYHDHDLQMPPKNQLPAAELASLEEWVKQGAPDPRMGAVKKAKTGMSLAEGRKFWSYQLPQKATPPSVKNTAWARSDIDRFLLAKLEEKNLTPAADADRVTLIRRVYFDLIGLPPTPEQIDAFVQDKSPDAYPKLVDRLLASPQFGERWGRHWLDVVRYAESVTLRGLVFKEAWRFRDYVIESFNKDEPYNQLVQEHIAGDLMTAGTVAEHQRQMIATAFLAMGNSNLEEQDKPQLDMDVVDEQLDTLGKAFLGQTIGCARCHDHKFDPIPTRDYYAMAGILRSTKTLAHANVSRWLDLPMPLPPEQEARMMAQEKKVEALEASLKSAKAELAKLDKNSRRKKKIVPVSDFSGILVDDEKAKKVGDWKHSVSFKQYIGEGYLHDSNEGKGLKTLTFVPELKKAGRYEVRLAYIWSDSRAKSVPVTIFSAEGEFNVKVNMVEEPLVEGRFTSLGQYRFEPNGSGFVLVSNEGTKGVVAVDAVQFVPVEELEPDVVVDNSTGDKKKSRLAELTTQIRDLERDLKDLKQDGPTREKVMSVQEAENPEDTFVHIRGSVHTLGDKVPRGFLQVATIGQAPAIPEKQSGRRELGEWIASRNNPLTARVYVNRAWHWLFGDGLVRTTDNFGTTGERPSNQALLDYLAVKFMDDGWSTKKLVRELVLSRAYQMSSTGSAADYQADPDNRLLSHMNRRRLEAEQIRDTILSVSGELKLDQGGSTIKPGTSADYNYVQKSNRRSIYMPVLRNSLPEIFEAFDFADPSRVVGDRNTSTVAPQALYLMNHPFVIEHAQLAAKRLLAEPGDDAGRIERAYRLTLGRQPDSKERELALQYVSQAPEREVAWSNLLQSLFSCVDFRYIN